MPAFSFVRSSLGIAVTLATACGRNPLPDEPRPDPIPPAGEPLPYAAYDAARDGLVVHEWGTLTFVVGSDGALLPGLHHEEEDLPPFVADRLAAARAGIDDFKFVTPARRTKMETPVTYFYAPDAVSMTARVTFRRGILTQWYPFVAAMYPTVLDVSPADGAPTELADRWRQQVSAIPPTCQPTFSYAGGLDGVLDWGRIDILPPGTSARLPADTKGTTWDFARRTASNLVAVDPPHAGGQHEKFLFYRGLGNVDTPVGTAFTDERALALTNASAQSPVRGLFLMNVTPGAAGFAELGRIDPGGRLDASIPDADREPRDFVAALKGRLARQLVDDGLYTDEALAMVDTWERSYFLTPGVRLLYLLPRESIDAFLPLHLEPSPDAVRRTMVIRVELTPPAHERTLVGWVDDLASRDSGRQAAARAQIRGLGRFAEPHLTRALALVGDATAQNVGASLLREIQGQWRWAPAWTE